MRPAVIVSVGARTPVGLTAAQTGWILRAGFPAMRSAPLADACGEPVTMCLQPTLDPLLSGADRAVRLALPALREAVLALGPAAAALTAHLAICAGEGSTHGPALVAALRPALAPLACASDTVTARGEASLVFALPDALARLDAGHADAVVVGGVHTDYDPAVIAALEGEGRLLSPENLDARIPGEAAAFAVLMRPDAARRHKLAPLARVIGIGAGRERARPDNDESAYEAHGLTAAVREATAGLLAADQRAGWVLNDLTFEMRRLHEWQSVLVRARRVIGDPYSVESPAQRIGHLGAAAMPLFAAICAEGWASGYAPSPRALATASSDGGDRGAMVLSEVSPEGAV